MTLPTGGGPWPPPPHAVAFSQQAIWSAWLVGDPEQLSLAYGAAGAGANPFNERPSQSAGGIVGTVARAFWGRPSASGQRKAKLHVPLAADIATASADLLWSEPAQFVIAGEPPAKKLADGTTTQPSKAQQRVDAILNAGDFHADMLEAAEIAAALGGAWLRLVWDTDVADRVMIDAVGADAAIGEWNPLDHKTLTAVTFFTEYADGQKIIRHLERHEPGAIYHGLYAGSPGKLGRPIPLADHPCTAPYVTLVNEEGAILTGVSAITAAYVANMRPQRRWRNVEAISNLGRSDFDGCEPLMDRLDEKYTQWMQAITLARPRILVPESMLSVSGRGEGALWDGDQEVFVKLKMALDDDTITSQQFIIDTDSFVKATETLIDQILDAAGYSPSTFGRGNEGVTTATEVVSRERKSARTRDKKCRYFSQALEPFLSVWLELDALIFKTGAKGAVEVQWADVTQPDPEVLSRTIETLNRALAVSVKTKVSMLHPDWTETQINDEVGLIGDVPDIGPLPFGGNGQGNPDNATVEVGSGLPE